MLLTENPEKVPDNNHCTAGGAGQPACSPGFFDAVRGGERAVAAVVSCLGQAACSACSTERGLREWTGGWPCRQRHVSAARSPARRLQNLENRPATLVPQQAHACCEGFFCPPELTCMMPCPLGSYCPR